MWIEKSTMFLNVLKACWQAWVLLHLVQVKSSPKNLSSLETNDRLGLTSYPGEATVFVGLVFTDVGTFPIRPRSDMDIILGIRSDDVDESDNKSPLNRVRSSFTPDVSGTWPYNTWYMHCIDTYSSLFFQLFNLINIQFLLPIVIFLLLKSELEIGRRDVAVWKKTESTLDISISQYQDVWIVISKIVALLILRKV